MVDCIFSRNGVSQGCGLGSLLLALSVQPIFEKIAFKFPRALPVAIMDDLYILGPPDIALVAYRCLEVLCREDGSLFLRKTKCKILHFSGQPLPEEVLISAADLKLKVESNAADVLGAPIGSEKFHMKKLSLEIIEKYRVLFTRVKDDRLLAFVTY